MADEVVQNVDVNFQGGAASLSQQLRDAAARAEELYSSLKDTSKPISETLREAEELSRIFKTLRIDGRIVDDLDRMTEAFRKMRREASQLMPTSGGMGGNMMLPAPQNQLPVVRPSYRILPLEPPTDYSEKCVGCGGGSSGNRAPMPSMNMPCIPVQICFFQDRAMSQLSRLVPSRLSTGPADRHDRAQREQRSRLPGWLAPAALAGLGIHAARQANPFAGERFDMALRDFTAVLGRSLVPALESLTGKIRSAADWVVTHPGFGSIVGALPTGLAAYAGARALGGVSNWAGSRSVMQGSVGQSRLAQGIIGAGSFLGRAGLPIAIGATALQAGIDYGRNATPDSNWFRKQMANLGAGWAEVMGDRPYGFEAAQNRYLTGKASGEDMRLIQAGRTNSPYVTPANLHGGPLEQYGVPRGAPSFGAGGVNFQYMGAEEFISSLRTQAAQSAYQTQINSAQATADNTEKMVGVAEQILEELRGRGVFGTATTPRGTRGSGSPDAGGS